MTRDNIDKIAQCPEDRYLLAKLWDKIHSGMMRCIPVNTGFLNPRELEMARFLFGEQPGLLTFGGYPAAERRMLVFLPDYLDEDWLMQDDSPVVCLRAAYFQDDILSHRDFLGALMAMGIQRDTVGDICTGKGQCDFFVTEDIAPWILQNFAEAGRVKVHISRIPLSCAQIPEPEVREIRDTLASLRLDSIISSGFRISRGQAAEYIRAGKAAVDALPCEKPDKGISAGCRISVRGLGKIKLHQVNGQTKKGRISVVIHRYI